MTFFDSRIVNTQLLPPRHLSVGKLTPSRRFRLGVILWLLCLVLGFEEPCTITMLSRQLFTVRMGLHTRRKNTPWLVLILLLLQQMSSLAIHATLWNDRIGMHTHKQNNQEKNDRTDHFGISHNDDERYFNVTFVRTAVTRAKQCSLDCCISDVSQMAMPSGRCSHYFCSIWQKDRPKCSPSTVHHPPLDFANSSYYLRYL